MTHSPLTNRVYLTSDSSVRTARIDRFIVHHAATTSLAAILALFQPGGREVSANYALGNNGELVLAVDEDRRAWTSAAANWDNRAVTIEVANSYAGDPWPVSDAAFDKLARLIADVSIRYGFPINDDTVLTHQELYRRYGDSYPTACPGDLQRRKGELLNLANHYRAGGGSTPAVPTEEEELMAVKDEIIASLRAVTVREARHRAFSDKAGRNALGTVGSVLPLSTNRAEAVLQATQVSAFDPLTLPAEELAAFVGGYHPTLEVTAFFRQVDTFGGGVAEYGEFVKNTFELERGATKHVRTNGTYEYGSRQAVWADLRPVEITKDGKVVKDFATVNGQKVAVFEDGSMIALTTDEVARANAQRPAGQVW